MQDIGVDSSNTSANTVHGDFYYYYVSTARIAVIDGGFYFNHEELSNLKKGTGKRNYHGTLVSGIIMAESNNVGYRGIVKPKSAYGLYYQHYGSTVKQKASFIKAMCPSFDVVNLSVNLSNTAYKDKGANFDLELHLDAMDAYREVFEACSKTLFVLSAGNSDVDAQKENGGIHYTYNSSKNEASYDPLDNVIVVGAHQGGLAPTQDYGESVDIYAPENVGGPYKSGSTYTQNKLGTSFSAPQVTATAGLAFKSISLRGKPAKVKEYILYTLKASNREKLI